MLKLEWMKEKQVWERKVQRKRALQAKWKQLNRFETIKPSYNLLQQNWLLTHQHQWLFGIELKHHVKHLSENWNPNVLSSSCPNWTSIEHQWKKIGIAVLNCDYLRLKIAAPQSIQNFLKIKTLKWSVQWLWDICSKHTADNLEVFSKVQRYCRSFSCFSFAALWMWNCTSTGNLVWTWMMWLCLVDDVKGSQRVVGREHKRAFQPKKGSSSVYCIFRIVSELSPSFKPFFRFWFYVCTFEDSSLLASRQESWMHGSQSFWVSWENLFNISIITLLSCWFWDQLSSI